jgi:hypothetical protein
LPRSGRARQKTRGIRHSVPSAISMARASDIAAAITMQRRGKGSPRILWRPLSYSSSCRRYATLHSEFAIPRLSASRVGHAGASPGSAASALFLSRYCREARVHLRQPTGPTAAVCSAKWSERSCVSRGCLKNGPFPNARGKAEGGDQSARGDSAASCSV